MAMSMHLSQLLPADRIVLGLKVRDKGQLIDALARRAAGHLPLPAPAIAAALIERERLGSTGLGKGFALPHVHLPGVSAPTGWLLRLARPIEFQAIDGRPVDLVFFLVNPADRAGDHLPALATIARLMRDPILAALARTATSATTLHPALLAAAGGS